MKPTVYIPLLTLAAMAACKGYSATAYSPPPPAHATFSAQGDSTTVAASLDAFRTALGGFLNPPAVPPADSGRREINWDGVPAPLTNVDTFPLAFFNVNSKRGAVYLTPGTGLRVDSTSFGSANAGLAAEFKPFSGKKLVMPVGSNQVSVDFKRSGTDSAGVVNGFGVVFSDVDRAGSARVEFFDARGVLIADLEAPAHLGAHEFSFIGAVFDSPIVGHVRITSGEAALDGTSADLSAGGTKDLVVMDDFVYGEPQP